MATKTDYKQLIRDRMIQEIESALTVGMEDDDRPAFTPEQIKEYIATNEQAIDAAICDMFEVYKEDNDLESLDNAKDEFLYDHLGLPDQAIPPIRSQDEDDKQHSVLVRKLAQRDIKFREYASRGDAHVGAVEGRISAKNLSRLITQNSYGFNKIYAANTKQILKSREDIVIILSFYKDRSINYEFYRQDAPDIRVIANIILISEFDEIGLYLENIMKWIDNQ